jgi:hypothetical protein
MKVLDDVMEESKVGARQCLHCRRMFTSEGPHNRVCRGCKQRAARSEYDQRRRACG